MHSAVLQNKKYIQFSEKYTVEVMALGRLQQGIDAGDRKAATYEAKASDGSKVEYLVEFPGLTVEQMLALARSRARSYNKTGRIPYTSIVNPHTLEEMHGISGGTSAKTIMEQVIGAKRALDGQHGTSISRSDYRALLETEAEASRLVAESEFKKALRAIDALAKIEWPQSLTGRVESIEAGVLDAARRRIEQLGAKAAVDRSAERDLRRLASELRGTALEDEAREALESAG